MPSGLLVSRRMKAEKTGVPWEKWEGWLASENARYVAFTR
jgi:hypothetical protein